MLHLRYPPYVADLKIKMRNSEFVFDYVHLLHYKCHRINFNCGGSYIDSVDWIKNKKSNNKSYE